MSTTEEIEKIIADFIVKQRKFQHIDDPYYFVGKNFDELAAIRNIQNEQTEYITRNFMYVFTAGCVGINLYCWYRNYDVYEENRAIMYLSNFFALSIIPAMICVSLGIYSC